MKKWFYCLSITLLCSFLIIPAPPLYAEAKEKAAKTSTSFGEKFVSGTNGVQRDVYKHKLVACKNH